MSPRPNMTLRRSRAGRWWCTLGVPSFEALLSATCSGRTPREAHANASESVAAVHALYVSPCPGVLQ